MVAGGVPVVYRSGGEAKSFSYDWWDGAAGAGYKRFYPCAAQSSGGIVYFLTTKAVDGDGTALTIAAGTFSFDIVFNNPVVIANGNAIINFTTLDGTVTFTLTKISVAGISTTIGTATSQNLGATINRRLIRVPTTLTALGVGDTLRLTIVTDATWLGIDPNGRVTQTEGGTGVTIINNVVADIPFRVDL